jgi:peptidyl-prolyl cis-trans isomerase SurA
MKKILLILLLPFAVLAQKSIQSKSKIVKDTPVALPVKADKKQNARNLIEGYRQRVINGESMATLAKLFSDDPGSASNGGLYSDIARGAMVPEFEKVAFGLKPGEISKVFETQFGFHFIQLLSRNSDTVTLRHLLVIPREN